MRSSEPPTAILFPGQGVGDASSRDLVSEVRPDLLELARELTGEDPFALLSESTRYAQPAVYCASIARFEWLGRPPALCFAGHSLGEIGALAAAGVIDDEHGLAAVVARGRAMEEAARAQPPGGMLAVGTDRVRAEELARGHGLALANENSPRQFVLAGDLGAIEDAEREAKAKGARVKRLPVRGAFHTEAMQGAVPPFRAALEKVKVRQAPTPVISSTTARPFEGDVREALAASLTRPIRWIEVMLRLRELGARRYLDVGPGKVLAGLVRRTIDGAEVDSVANLEAAVA